MRIQIMVSTLMMLSMTACKTGDSNGSAAIPGTLSTQDVGGDLQTDLEVRMQAGEVYASPQETAEMLKLTARASALIVDMESPLDGDNDAQVTDSAYAQVLNSVTNRPDCGVRDVGSAATVHGSNQQSCAVFFERDRNYEPANQPTNNGRPSETSRVMGAQRFHLVNQNVVARTLGFREVTGLKANRDGAAGAVGQSSQFSQRYDIVSDSLQAVHVVVSGQIIPVLAQRNGGSASIRIIQMMKLVRGNRVVQLSVVKEIAAAESGSNGRDRYNSRDRDRDDDRNSNPDDRDSDWRNSPRRDRNQDDEDRRGQNRGDVRARFVTGTLNGQNLSSREYSRFSVRAL